MSENENQSQAGDVQSGGDDIREPQSVVMPPVGTPELLSYPLPVDIESLSADGANSLLKSIYADAACDKNHPYTDAHHPQSRDFKAVVTRLHEIKAAGWDNRHPIEKACDEAMAAKVEKQNLLVEEAEKELAALVELGFDDDEIPDDVKEYQVRGLREQRLYAEGNFAELMPMLVKDLEALRYYEDANLLQNFQATHIFDEDFIKDSVYRAIFKIADENKKKYGVK